MFQEGDRVDITATSKGRGFAGGVKRHGFHGGPKTHGQSDRTRAPGAIGAGNTPGRVFKGLRMAGHMGAEQVTVKNIEVLQTNPARGLLIVAGSVPGNRNGLVKIRLTRATLEAARTGKRKAPEVAEEPEPEQETAPQDTSETAAPPAAEAEAEGEAVAQTESPGDATAGDDAAPEEAPE
jgi:hypothetical protein